MLRICPHHGLKKWLIVHTFYNDLSYTTKMTVDAAAGVNVITTLILGVLMSLKIIMRWRS